jgi:Dolichyl-phosphate-mannose-protein mannosyltransferase
MTPAGQTEMKVTNNQLALTAARFSPGQFFKRARYWLSARLTPATESDAAPRRRKLIIAPVIFLIALGVCWLHRGDAYVEMQQGQSLRAGRDYRAEAERMIDAGELWLPRSLADRGDARMIVHPPGYSLLLVALSKPTGDAGRQITALQMAGEAAAATLVFFIAAELLPLLTATLAGLLVAFSPHYAYYSLWVSPDTLAGLPILLAIVLLIRAYKRPGLVAVIAAGAMLGVSCWLRANALLLAPFLGLVILLLFERARRWRYAAALVAATLAVVAPITIRNYILYHRFVPLSLGAGITLIEGISDYDRERRFALPRTDDDVSNAEAQWYGRDDYAINLWVPDGVERDRDRMRRGLAVVGAHPAWFVGTMLRRALWMISYNDSRPHDWPFDTANVPLISAAPGFSHALGAAPDRPPVWSNNATELLAGGEVVAPASAMLAADDSALQLTGDASIYGDQFISAPFVVEKNTDYLLRLAVDSRRETLAAKVTSLDRRLALASVSVPATAHAATKAERRNARRAGEESAPGNSPNSSMSVVEIPFATGPHEQVRVVLSNNGSQADAALGTLQLFQLGPTPHTWTTALRPPLRGLQKNLYTTARLLPLVGLGLGLLALGRGWRLLLALLAVPLYYLLAQSALHTEYRYILTLHYFLFVMAATTLQIAGALTAAGLRHALARARRAVRSYRG